MRFHIGFSKRISFKWFLLIIGGLLAFFGIDKAFAATSFSVDASNVLVLSPQADTYISELGQTITRGNLINQSSSTPYFSDWESQRYSSFKTITSPYTALGYRDSIQNARLRWDYSKSSMAKCSSGQYITYTFKVYLRTIQSGTLPQLWNTADIYQDILIRTSDTNYSCTQSNNGHILIATCTIPNPTSTVYFHIEGFTIPYGSVIDNGYYNVGVAPISYECSSDSSGLIINNNNQNTQQIINNNNQNTQNITNSIDDLTGVVNDTSVPNYEDLPQFVIENMAISSQSQKLFMLPIQLLNAVVSGSEGCNSLKIDLSSITQLGGGGSYILEIPCMGSRIKNYIGSTWYEIFDYIMAAIVFYYVGTNIVIRIQQIMSGVDTLPSYYTSHGKTKTALVDSETGEVIGNG